MEPTPGMPATVSGGAAFRRRPLHENIRWTNAPVYTPMPAMTVEERAETGEPERLTFAYTSSCRGK